MTRIVYGLLECFSVFVLKFDTNGEKNIVSFVFFLKKCQLFYESGDICVKKEDLVRYSLFIVYLLNFITFLWSKWSKMCAGNKLSLAVSIYFIWWPVSVFIIPLCFSNGQAGKSIFFITNLRQLLLRELLFFRISHFHFLPETFDLFSCEFFGSIECDVLYLFSLIIALYFDQIILYFFQ